MRIRKSELVMLGVLLVSFVIGFCFFPRMPEKVASHWNERGGVDGYSSKFWGVFLMPIILTGLSLLFITIPRIDPLKENIEQFTK